MTRERVTAVTGMLLPLLVVAGGWLVWHHPEWPADFKSFWAASRLVLQGRAAAVYDPVAELLAQGVAPGQQGMAFFYPPTFLLIVWPFGLLPFGWAMPVWLGVTLALWLVSLRVVMPLEFRSWVLPVVAMPAVWLNLAAGQNGFLTAALLNLAVGWGERFPVAAGVCLGCLGYKPQFAFVLPVALVALGRWRVVAVSAVTAAAMVGASVWVFGAAAWRGFLAQPAGIDEVLRTGSEAPGKMVSLLGVLMAGHAPAWVGYGAQVVLSLVVCGLVWVFVRRGPGVVALVSVGSVLASPWLHRYDLVLLVPAAGWIASASRALVWERPVLVGLYWLPLATAMMGTGARFPLDILGVALLMVLVPRRLGLGTD